MACTDASSCVSSAQQSAVRQQVEIAVAKKGQDAARQSGQAVIELLNSAIQLSKSIGTGGGLDLVA